MTPQSAQPVVWLVLQPGGILGAYDGYAEAQQAAQSTGNLLTHLPIDADYRQR